MNFGLLHTGRHILSFLAFQISTIASGRKLETSCTEKVQILLFCLVSTQPNEFAYYCMCWLSTQDVYYSGLCNFSLYTEVCRIFAIENLLCVNYHTLFSFPPMFTLAACLSHKTTSHDSKACLLHI